MSEKTFGNLRAVTGRFCKAVRACPTLRPRDKLVIATMLDYLDRDAFARCGDLLTWDGVGVEALARATALSTRDVERARAEALRTGIVELVQRPAKGRAARYRFRPEWPMEQLSAVTESATPDTGVADSGGGCADQRPPEMAATPAKIAAQRPTPESPLPSNDLGIHLGRAGAHASPRATASVPIGSVAGLRALLAREFTAAEIARWFSGCSLELDGDGVKLRVPQRFQRDWIAQTFEFRLRTVLGVDSLAIEVGAPPLAIPPAGRLKLVHAVGREA